MTPLEFKMAALYLLIGLGISIVGKAWNPREPRRSAWVATIQIVFLVTLWLPSLLAAMIWHNHTETK